MNWLQQIVDSVRDTFTEGAMAPGERALWAQANTLDDLCQLNIAWLNGELSCTPWYCGSLDVDEELAPGLTDALIALTRAGFLTDNSQGAYDGPDYAASPWEAWVSGYADDATFEWLAGVVRGTDYRICAWPPADSRSTWRRAHLVGDAPDSATGGGGSAMSAGDIRAIYRDCTDDAIGAICAAWQVTIYDPEPGRNDMWALLQQAAEDRVS